MGESGIATVRAGIGAKESELPCFGVPLRCGAIVSVKLDCDNRTLTFALDGIWGPVFRDLPPGPFFAYLSLYSAELSAWLFCGSEGYGSVVADDRVWHTVLRRRCDCLAHTVALRLWIRRQSMPTLLTCSMQTVCRHDCESTPAQVL